MYPKDRTSDQAEQERLEVKDRQSPGPRATWSLPLYIKAWTRRCARGRPGGTTPTFPRLEEARCVCFTARRSTGRPGRGQKGPPTDTRHCQGPSSMSLHPPGPAAPWAPLLPAVLVLSLPDI